MSSTSEFEYSNIFYKSRLTLMELLESRGYETTPFSRFSPKETKAMLTYLTSADILAPHKDDPERKCAVIYIDAKPKVSITELVQSRMKGDFDFTQLEVILMVKAAEVGEAYTQIVYNDWVKFKLRVSAFSIYNLNNNPTKHVLVPKHEIVPEEEHEALLEKLMVNSKSQLPIIRFHFDMQARWLGLVPGDIVKITRPSPSAGVYIMYRVCAL
jgi:DNA-directed RNA polymerase I, II, and III subunit RPABC1